MRISDWSSDVCSSDLGEQTAISLVPITGEPTAVLVRLNPFLRRDSIPAGVYPGVGEVATLTVAAQWITREDIGAAPIYGILQALWRSDARALRDRGHITGRRIRLETASTEERRVGNEGGGTGHQRWGQD